MNEAKLRSIEAGQTSIARKVLAAVPIQEHWTAHQIMGELKRQGKQIGGITAVESCLRQLHDAGLIRHDPSGWWRTQPHVSSTFDDGLSVKGYGAMSGSEETITFAPEPVTDPFTRIVNLTGQVRGLLDEIEECSLEMAKKVEAAEAKSEDLRKLRELLSKIV
jgi:hypothetical protein